MNDTATFTRTAARMVAANDRAELRRRIRALFTRAVRRAHVA